MDLEAVYAYNNEGRVISITYPAGQQAYGGGHSWTPAFTFGYDSMGRTSTVTAGGVAIYLTQNFYSQVAADQAITLVHELLHLTYGGESDMDVAARFGIAAPSGLTGDAGVAAASLAITAWLGSDCGRLK